MLRRIGYVGDRESLGNITKAKMSPTWFYLFDTIIHCDSGKIGGWDQVTIVSLTIVYGLIRNEPINFGALIFYQLHSKIGFETLFYSQFISLILIISLGEKYSMKGEHMDAVYVAKCIFKQLVSKNAGEEQPLTLGMLSVISSSKRPLKPTSKGATKRKEPSFSQAQASKPSKKSKSNRIEKPTTVPILRTAKCKPILDSATCRAELYF